MDLNHLSRKLQERSDLIRLSKLLTELHEDVGLEGPWLSTEAPWPLEAMAVLRCYSVTLSRAHSCRNSTPDRHLVYFEQPDPPRTLADWCEEVKLWRGGCDFLGIPPFLAPYPHPPCVNWWKEVGKLPQGEKLLKEHTISLELLMAYTNPLSARGSEVSQDSYCGLTKWRSNEASTMWQAGSMQGIPDELFIPQFPRPPGVPSNLSACMRAWS
eukprot:698954-Pelagomonas_calceolata.AAC.1